MHCMSCPDLQIEATIEALWRGLSKNLKIGAARQGCAGRSFFQRGGAGTKIRREGQAKGENPRGGAKERVNRLIQKFDKSA